jgi:hypothetical protein
MEKIKQFVESEQGKDILTVIIVVLVGLSCFELGRLSKENSTAGIKIDYPNQNGSQGAGTILSDESVQTTAPTTNSVSSKIPVATYSSGKSYFASSKGSKYYSIGCSAGKTIKQENRVYFATGEEAQTAGYTLSASCK